MHEIDFSVKIQQIVPNNPKGGCAWTWLAGSIIGASAAVIQSAMPSFSKLVLDRNALELVSIVG